MNKKLFLTSFAAASSLLVMADTDVTGVVVDKRNEGVPGVRVEVVGRSEYVMTDIDGRYLLELPDEAGKTKLRFTYPGYKAFEKKAKPDMTVKLGTGWDSKQSGYRGFFDFQGGFGGGGLMNVEAGNARVDNIGKNTLMFGWSMTHGYQINPHLFVGLGFGIYSVSMFADEIEGHDWGGVTQYDMCTRHAFTGFNFPLFAEVRWDFGLTEKTAPFVSLKLGYQFIGTTDEGFTSYSHIGGHTDEVWVYAEPNSGILLQPTVGMRMRLMHGRKGMNFGVTYNALLRRKFEAEYYHPGRQGNEYKYPYDYMTLGPSTGGVFMLNIGFDW